MSENNGEITYIDASGKKISINKHTEINIIRTKHELNADPKEIVDTGKLKDALLDSLYSQVEFLRDEIKEKNLLIRALTIRYRENEFENANDVVSANENGSAAYVPGAEDDEVAVFNDARTDERETTVNETPVFNSTININNSIVTTNIQDQNNEENDSIALHDLSYPDEHKQIELTKNRMKNQLERLITHLKDQKYAENENEPPMTSTWSMNDEELSNADETEVSYNSEDSQFKFEWEKHSSGFAGRIFQKMGYKGKGLGKNEDGITEAITIADTQLSMGESNTRQKQKLLYVASSSMLNQMEEKRLSRGDIQVKVRCHGGCTIKCMYTHLPEMFALKPDFVLLHIGSNDCSKEAVKTSDEVLQEFKKLAEFISWNLPCTKLILSLPIVRRDSSVAHYVQRNLQLKMRRLLYPCLDHSNVDFSHLGKKGLHLNHSGTKLVASNIISLVKQL